MPLTVRRLGVFAPLVALLAAGVGLIAQGQTPTPQSNPVFHSRADLVRLDVSVLDKDRHPVRGLIATDFTVSEDGKPQEIVAFESVDVADPEPAEASWMREVTPDVTTNETKASRLWVIAIDDALIPTDPWIIKNTRKIVTDIIDKFGPDDLAAIVMTGNNRRAQDFTNDRAKLMATLDQFNPGLASWHGFLGDLQFYLSSVNTVLNVMDAFVAMPHTRKAMIWVTPGIPVDFNSSVPVEVVRPAQDTDGAKRRASQDVHLRLVDLSKKVFEIGRRANVPIYPIDPCGLFGLKAYIVGNVGYPDPPEALWIRAMDDMLINASNTGGHAIVNTNDATPGINSIFKENSSYYLIGYVPTNTKNDGQVRRLEVKVNRKDVDVRTNSEYIAPKSATAGPQSTNATLADAVAAAIPLQDLPLRATVAAFAIPGRRNAAVSIALGVRQPVPEAAASGRVSVTTELRTSAFTNEGEPRGTQRNTAKVVLRAGAQGDADYEALSRIDLAPGRYRLRLAAYLESASKTGTVMVDIVVPDFNGERASMSGVVLGATPGRPSAPRDLLAGIVPLIPTAQRVFVQSDRATALFYLYQNGKQPVTPARVAVRILDAHGEARVNDMQELGVERFVAATSAPKTPNPTDIGGVTGGSAAARSATLRQPQTQGADAFANKQLRAAEFQYQIPLNRLAAGPYLLTFEATIGTSVLRRDVQFEVR